MSTYLSDRAAVESDIRAEGIVATLTRTTPGTYNPVTDTETGGSTASYSVPCLIKSPEVSSGGNGWRYMPGTQVQTGDVQLLMGASTLGLAGLQPKPGDQISIPSGELAGLWSVVASVPVAPGGVALMFKTLARKP